MPRRARSNGARRTRPAHRSLIISESIVRLVVRLGDRVDAACRRRHRPLLPDDRRRSRSRRGPDASLWLTVTLGPRSLNSRPARLAAELPTVLSKSSAGALRRSAAKERVRDTAASIARRRSRSRARRRSDRRPPALRRSPRVAHRQLRQRPGVDAGAIDPPQLHRRDPLRRLESGRPAPRAPSGTRSVSNPFSGAIPLRPASIASRNAACDGPNAETTPMPETRNERCTRVRYHRDEGSNGPRPHPGPMLRCAARLPASSARPAAAAARPAQKPPPTIRSTSSTAADSRSTRT